jgi:heme-degrading monooxygenase HmoA
VIRSVLYLTPRGGDGRAIADFYRRHRVLERAVDQDGCLAADLELPATGSGDVLVTALWRDVDAYQGWVDSPFRSANAEELAELVDGFDDEVRGSLYEIAIEAGPGR